MPLKPEGPTVIYDEQQASPGRFIQWWRKHPDGALGLAAAGMVATFVGGVMVGSDIGEGKGISTAYSQQDAREAAEMAAEEARQQEVISAVEAALTQATPDGSEAKLDVFYRDLEESATKFAGQEGMSNAMWEIQQRTGVSIETTMGAMALAGGVFSLERANTIADKLVAEHERTASVREDYGSVESGETIIGALGDQLNGSIINLINRGSVLEDITSGATGIYFGPGYPEDKNITSQEFQRAVGVTIWPNGGDTPSITIQEGISSQAVERAIEQLNSIGGSLVGPTCKLTTTCE